MSRITEINGVGVADLPAFRLGPFDRVVEVRWGKGYSYCSKMSENLDIKHVYGVYNGSIEFNGNLVYEGILYGPLIALLFDGYVAHFPISDYSFVVVMQISGWAYPPLDVDQVVNLVKFDDYPVGYRTMRHRFLSYGKYNLDVVYSKLPITGVGSYKELTDGCPL